MIIRRMLFYCFILFAGSLFAQQEQPAATIIEFPPGYIPAVDKKINGLDNQLSRQSEKYLDRLSRREEKIFKSLSTIDSSAAASMLKSGKKQYEQLNKKLTAANGKACKLLSGKYLPGVDSLDTSLSFLKDAGNIVSKSKDIQQQLGQSLENLNLLQNRLNEADAIQRYVQQRQQQLKQLRSNYSNLPKEISKHFGKYQQTVFYYSQQLADLRESLDQPDKLIAKTLALLQHIPEFSTFWKKHSILNRKDIALARSVQNPVPGQGGLGYGYGWFVNTRQQPAYIYHSGGNGGFRTYSFSIPELNYLVVIFANRSDINIEQVVMQINQIVFPDLPALVPVEVLTS